jgi:hypothetical protein
MSFQQQLTELCDRYDRERQLVNERYETAVNKLIRTEQANLFGPAQLPTVCMELRMGTNGSGDPWPPDLVRQTRALLTAKLAHWRPSDPAKRRPLDDAVKALIEATLEETA